MNKAKIPVAQREALGTLLDDHRKVKKLFKEFESTKSDARKLEIAQQTCNALKVHTQLEEEIFYPSLRQLSTKLDKLLNEAEVEHASAKTLIAQIETGEPGPAFEARYTVLSEYVEHHVEEEENEMFQQVIDNELDLRDVAQQMAQRREELESSLEKEPVPA